MAAQRNIDRSPDDEAGVHAAERRLEREADALEAESRKVAAHVEEVRRDWEAKRADPSLPGARPREDVPAEAVAEEGAGDWEGTSQAAKRAGQ